MSTNNSYTENAEKWKVLADIDYVTQFVKAWIAFNAWYKNYYPGLDTDKKAIDEIKTNHNKFKDTLQNLLEGVDNDSNLIKNEISNLHHQLSRYQVRNKDQRISFENIIIERNPTNQEILTKNTMRYEATINPNNFKDIELKITDQNGNYKIQFQPSDGYNLDELLNDTDYNNLSHTQKDYLKYCYEEINPDKPINLIFHEGDFIEFGSYKFINDTDKICKGVITALYLLRNSLFHGQIIPDKEANKVYGPAYHILHKLVEAL